MSLIFLLFWIKKKKNSERNFAIIPHFMLDSWKVDQFYNFLKNEYYNSREPEKIILISPNHFHSETNIAKTICASSKVSYKSKTIVLNSDFANLWIDCDKEENIFYSWWKSVKTNEHGIGEHFQWIKKYFPDSEVLPIIMPSFNYTNAESILPIFNGISGNILVIASVDFAHYQNEKQTLQHDQKSIETLKSMILNESDFMKSIDADCHACLYLLQNLASKNWKKAEFRYRDSSSTILNQDMWAENTSRIFMWYK